MHFGRIADEKYERHSETSSYLIHRPGSYVYVNTDSVGTSTYDFGCEKKKKREIREDGNTFWDIPGGGEVVAATATGCGVTVPSDT